MAEVPMIERIGRILFRQARGVPCAPASQNWRDYESNAREIIAAMREPTDAMMDAGNQSGDWGPGSTADGTDASPERCWNAMIDAALK